MQDGTPWPGNNVRDHPGMIQVSDFSLFFWLLDVGALLQLTFAIYFLIFSYFIRSSLAKMVFVILRIMNYLVLSMFLVKRDQDSITIKKLAL